MTTNLFYTCPDFKRENIFKHFWAKSYVTLMKKGYFVKRINNNKTLKISVGCVFTCVSVVRANNFVLKLLYASKTDNTYTRFDISRKVRTPRAREYGRPRVIICTVI